MALTTVTRTQAANRALKDGSVRPRGVELEFVEVDPLIKAFRQMVRERAYDVSEMAITTYLVAKEHGKRFTALPIFLVRDFHHAAVVAPEPGDPKALEGRRVGVNRGYTVTTGVWARGVLAREHAVDLDSVTWVLSGDEHVAEFTPPANVVPLEKGRKMAELLASGELPAAINVETDSPDVRPLIPNAKEAGFAALKARGHYPINHTVVVRDELLEAHPNLAREVFEAFAESKRLYVDKLRAGKIEKPTPADEVHRRVMEITGADPLPYGIEPNRATLEELISSAVEQGILSRAPKIEDLFARGAQDLVG
jgi:ABC-type nitrate/sulfonate/bicarbonate transport system substrate-binding protein